MNAKLTINDVEKKFKESSLAVYAAILTTDNPGALTVANAVKRAGGAAFVESVENYGDLTDSFVIVKEITRKGKKGTTTGKATRFQLVNRMKLALSAADWQAEITVDGFEKGESSESDNGEIEVG